MIRNLIFDIGGVLIDLDPQRTLDAFAPLLKGSCPQFTDLSLLGGGGSDVIGDYMRGELSNDEFLTTLLSLCKEGTTKTAVVEAWNKMLLGFPQERARTIDQLHKAGFRIALLSNINDEHLKLTRQLLQEVGLEVGQNIDFAFFSNEVHLAKPDRAIYELALQRTGFDPAHTLYIDDLEPNIAAGRAMGLQTCLAKGDEWLPVVSALLTP